jgi:hypothetical protein
LVEAEKDIGLRQAQKVDAISQRTLGNHGSSLACRILCSDSSTT